MRSWKVGMEMVQTITVVEDHHPSMQEPVARAKPGDEKAISLHLI